MPPINLARYREIVILTGAGVSVASGLPTYRGTGGLWTTTNGIEFANAAALAKSPEQVWAFFAQIRAEIGRAVPNEAHRAIAQAETRLEPSQRLTVLTQNVDGLHAISGTRRVVELHGSLRRSRCTKCDYSQDEDLSSIAATCPSCAACGATMRPDVVLFDEPLSVEAERGAKVALRTCDLFIAVGTSGTVSPASNYVRAAEYVGARTIYVNLEPMTPANPAFREVCLGPAEILLPKLLGLE